MNPMDEITGVIDTTAPQRDDKFLRLVAAAIGVACAVGFSVGLVVGAAFL